MQFLRNKQVRMELMISIAITISATLLAFLWEIRFGVLVFILCVLLNAVHFYYTYKRYKSIQQLAADIDKILHGNVPIVLDQYEEGELAILESEVQKMTIRLREQQQQLLEDKKYLADSIADISHQIRTPLTSINLLLSFLAEPNLSEEKQQKTVREIYELLSRIEWLITTLLKISKLDAGTIQLKSEEYKMQYLIEKSVAPLLIPMELRGQELRVQAEGKFCGDLDWTCEAIGNIVKNCMEHTPEGGSVSIITTENPIFQEIVISDTGCGIASEDLPHIFERFYKGKNSSNKSFGIGLALARGIVSNQNGTIKVENQKAGGAKFTIRFYKELSS
ncbi:MAG: HAMP domain-containing histidine kinase [Agathobacter sp.]|nr:HAMP domain-containing histidine kinase [Agathobacter sp.]